ncbi:AEC family transporter (plasmid) [Paroceanicella profunda]|uniref:AEC family transporter n=1 Tax=Paroceanicella profunda TaxID=2579971 RepID=A0A5B8FJ85_9RHOB|nr:AEC family transporter [Paroceanicella profunda]QDL94631.1 AEC family transporter [Paroceanicella profunda]
MTGMILLALAPIVLLIGLGLWLRRSGFLPGPFWAPAERLSYFVLLPALFTHGLATADLSGVPVLAMALTLICATLVAAAIVLCAERFLGLDGPSFTSVFQGSVRFNNYVGVTIAAGLFGVPGIAMAAVANAAIVPTVNILCAGVFARSGPVRPGLRGLARGIMCNPLILGCAAGLGLRLTGLGLPPGIDGALKALGSAALPLGLLCVGAAMDLRVLGGGLRPALLASAAKFALLPLATVVFCRLWGLHGQAALVAVMFQALPTASSSYVMARQLGGNAPLMAAIISFQTAVALVAVPVAMLLLGPVAG